MATEPGKRTEECDVELLGRAYMAAFNERVPEPLLESLHPGILVRPATASHELLDSKHKSSSLAGAGRATA